MFYMHVSHECTCMHAPTYLWVYVRMEWKMGGPINIAKTLLSTQVAELCVGLQMPARFHPSVSRQYRLTLFADNTSKASKRKLVNTQTSETLQRIDQSTDQHIIKGQINR